jgi:hypothetical protein
MPSLAIGMKARSPAHPVNTVVMKALVGTVCFYSGKNTFTHENNLGAFGSWDGCSYMNYPLNCAGL